MNKQKIKIFETCCNVVSFMKPHCSMLQKNLRFGTSHEPWILMFGVSNAKYLTFDTLDSNALSHQPTIDKEGHLMPRQLGE